MERAIARVIFVVLCSLTGLAIPISGSASTIVLDFPPDGVPYPDFTQITTQYIAQGVVFSTFDGDLPPAFQLSVGAQENLVVSNTFINLFRLDFIGAEPVVSVSIIFGDNNSQAQTHTLTAFDAALGVLDSDSFADGGDFGDVFTLTVQSLAGIHSVVAIEQPFGAERVERISFRTVPEPSTVLLLAAGLFGLGCRRTANPRRQKTCEAATELRDGFAASVSSDSRSCGYREVRLADPDSEAGRSSNRCHRSRAPLRALASRVPLVTAV